MRLQDDAFRAAGLAGISDGRSVANHITLPELRSGARALGLDRIPPAWAKKRVVEYIRLHLPAGLGM